VFAKHLPRVVLNPVEKDGGPVFEVSGSWTLVPHDDALLVVARDGIEPPTPAFSGLATPRAITIELKGYRHFGVPKTVRFLGQ